MEHSTLGGIKLEGITTEEGVITIEEEGEARTEAEESSWGEITT